MCICLNLGNEDGDSMKKYCKGCGTELTATNGKGELACPICFGMNKDSGVVVEKPDNEKGYVCLYCKKISKKPIAFSNPEPTGVHFQKGGKWEGLGEHYDGCFGWD